MLVSVSVSVLVSVFVFAFVFLFLLLFQLVFVLILVFFEQLAFELSVELELNDLSKFRLSILIRFQCVSIGYSISIDFSGISIDFQRLGLISGGPPGRLDIREGT